MFSASAFDITPKFDIIKVAFQWTPMRHDFAKSNERLLQHIRGGQKGQQR